MEKINATALAKMLALTAEKLHIPFAYKDAQNAQPVADHVMVCDIEPNRKTPIKLVTGKGKAVAWLKFEDETLTCENSMNSDFEECYSYSEAVLFLIQGWYWVMVQSKVFPQLKKLETSIDLDT